MNWQLLDLGIALVELGFNRAEIVKGVREQEENGASPRQIGEYLKGLEAQYDAEAQKKIDDAPGAYDKV